MNDILEENLIKEIKFLLNFCKDMTYPIRNINPMFYITGSYENDVEIYNRVERIRKMTDTYE